MKINIGRYIPGDSIIHKMDARIKLFSNISFIVLFFLANTFILQAILVFPLLISFIIATRKPLHLLKMMIMPIIVGFFILIINMFVLDTSDNTHQLQPGEIFDWKVNWWWHFKGIVKIDYVIVMTTLSVVFRIYAIMLTMTLLTLSTQSVLITKALDFYFYPLKLIKIPVHIFTMIITIAFRFVPTLVDEASRIFKAQASRGMDFKNGSIKTKINSVIVLIIPLFVSSFTKADDLANAMETRGYDPYLKRTSYRSWKFGWFDFIALIGVISFVVLSSLLIINPNGIFNFPQWWINTKCVF
ncbi:MAG: energy-coupling factor transporter transmembrane protein EcfT [Mycoplasmataceae bacterium]|nr:energy-coupling factor transporter transmembrane protein EcfT [Mycoplasmataceae bacterium]MBR4025328.1 energy-coupling factor transporter transmembrane protein EcfT [Mycoplasmataceae bacterium]